MPPVRLIAVLLLACGALPVAAETLAVVVSIPPQAYFLDRIAGPRVATTVMVQPGQEPETFEPKPSQLVAVARSSLYFAIGLPFEDAWLARLVRNNPRLQIVSCQAGIPFRSVDGDTRPGDGAYQKDPHTWTSPVLAERIAENMHGALVLALPQHAAALDAGLDRLRADLRALHGSIENRLRPLRGRTMLVYHPAWGYFANAYGLQQLAIESGGREPTPRTLTNIIDRARRDRIRTVFFQEQFSSSAAQRVAEALEARLVSIDPLAHDYLSNMQRLSRALAESL